MEIRKSVCLCVMLIMLIAIPAGADVILTPTEDTWLYGSAYSLQGGHNEIYYGNPDPTEGEWNITSGPLDNPSVVVENDPISSADDGLLLNGLSSFAIAESTLADLSGWSDPDGSDTFLVFVNNQATQDPGSENLENPYGPEGFGESLSSLYVTYNTSPGDNTNIGDPITVTLSLNLSEQLHVSDWNDVYYLEIGYSLGTNLTGEEVDGYAYWSSDERYIRPFTEDAVFSDSLVYSCNVGDQVEMRIDMYSYSYSQNGYAWTRAPGADNGQYHIGWSTAYDAASNAKRIRGFNAAYVVVTSNNNRSDINTPWREYDIRAENVLAKYSRARSI